MQKVHLEVAAVTLAAHDVAQLCHHFSRGVRLRGRQYLAPDVIATPAAPARSQLRITDETRHRGADDSAVAGHGTLEAHLDIADALHDFDFLLRGQVTGMLVPVALTVHKERPAACGTISDRDDEIVS